jgi:hypothetical protein
MHSLHHEDIVDGDDIDILNTFGFEFAVQFDVSRDLATTSSSERSWDANLQGCRPQVSSQSARI